MRSAAWTELKRAWWRRACWSELESAASALELSTVLYLLRHERAARVGLEGLLVCAGVVEVACAAKALEGAAANDLIVC